MAGIAAWGAYAPRLRLSRKAVTEANAWVAPNLKAKGKGERSMANWDEDALTMAVEAARDALGSSDDRSHIDSLYFASTTAPFADRLNAGIVSAALTLEKSDHRQRRDWFAALRPDGAGPGAGERWNLSGHRR